LFKLGGREPLIKKVRWRIFEKGNSVEDIDQRYILTRPREDSSEPCISWKLCKLGGGEPLIKRVRLKN
jgi:hypothetical protein